MITEYGIEAKSNAEIIAELGARYKAYRVFCNLTQKEVADKSGVSIFTISQFEKGCARNIGYGTILSLLRSIGFIAEAEKLLPELPPLPSEILKQKKKKERVRHER
jgi:transcriptional regulator with XRE-family HTH domain